MTSQEVIIKTCKYCGKEIKSLYETQAEQNLEAHEKTCKKRKTNEKNN